jgi:ketoreductase
MNQNTGRTALITGASGGIGKAIAIGLCKDGFNPILVARHGAKLRDTAGDLAAQFPELSVRTETCDVADSAQVTALYTRLQAAGLKVDILVNGAGISGGGVTAQITDDVWLNVMNTNLNGMFFMTRELLRLEMMGEGGRIINIASTGGKQGVIHGSPYCASKHGMVGFTKALGLELARNNSGITVNAVCPGFVETEMAERVRQHYAKIWGVDLDEARRRVEERVPIGRYIEPCEVAAMVSYVASPAAAGVTAQALNVCGGLGNY